MKKFLVAALLATVAGQSQAALKVFACEPEWGSLAGEIGGDRVSVYTATSAQQDPHHVEAKPSLIAQVRKADLVACSGAGLEVGWLPVLLARGANPELKGERLFYAAEKVQRVGIPTGPVDRGQGDVHPEGNPHVHLDPQRVMQIGDALAKTLGDLDPTNAAFYTQRAGAFRQRLTKALADSNVAALRAKNYFVYHDAWAYLFAWLGSSQAGTLEPLPGIPPSSQHLSQLAAQAKSQHVDAIVHASYDDLHAVDWLQHNSGVCAIELPYTVGGDARATDLVALYQDIAARLNAGCK